MHYTGLILSRLAIAIQEWSVKPETVDKVTITNRQQNGAYGVHQATVCLSGDPNTYRLILAPADAPITINGRPIGEHFAKPLGDR